MGYFPHYQKRSVDEETCITLYPLARLTGIVRDRESGAPIRGAELRLGHTGLDADREAAVLTNAAGQFEGLAVPRGKTFPLSIEANGYQHLVEMLVLRSNEHSLQHVVNLERALIARFAVLDLENGAPLEGAVIRARGGSYETDERGEVDVSRSFRPADETHELIVSAVGHCETVFELRDLDSLNGPIPLRVPRSCRIEGVVLDSMGVPIPGLCVTAGYDDEEFQAAHDSSVLAVPQANPTCLSSARLDLFATYQQKQSTGKDGRFFFDGFPADLLTVQLDVQLEGRVVARRNIGTFGSPGWVEHVRIQLEPPSNASVHGRLLFNGRPVSGRVHWRGPTLDGWCDVDADGVYELLEVEPGSVMLVGEPRTSKQNLSQIARAEVQIQVGHGSRVECDLAVEIPMATISGRVIGFDGEPYPEAMIHLSVESPYGMFKSTSDNDGNWLANVPESGVRYRISTQLPTREGELVAYAGSRNVDFHVARTGTLRYRAQSADDGAPIAGSWLKRRVDHDRFMTVGIPGRSSADSAGWHHVDLPEGKHELFVILPGGRYQAAGRTVRLAPATVTEVIFELERAYTVTMRLAEDCKSFPPGYSVICVKESDWLRIQAHRDGELIDWVWDGFSEHPFAQRVERLEDSRDLGLGGLAPGRYLFKTFPEDLIVKPDWIDVPAESQPVEVRWLFRK